MVVQAPEPVPMGIVMYGHGVIARCWSAGTILLNVEVVWEISDQTATEDNHSNGDEIWE